MTEQILRPQAFFDLSDPATAAFFEGCAYVWEALPPIKHHVARLTSGGKRIDGTVMDAHVLDRVAPGMRIYGEESFGPIVTIVRVSGMRERPAGRPWAGSGSQIHGTPRSISPATSPRSLIPAACP